MSKKFDADILLLIKYLNKLIESDFNKRLIEHDITAQQGRILFYITHLTLQGTEVHQNDIEKRFNLTKSTVSGLVDRLETKGLINKIQGPRYAILTPSDEAVQMNEDFIKCREKVIERMTNNITIKEKEVFVSVIKKIIDNMKEDDKYVEKD